MSHEIVLYSKGKDWARGVFVAAVLGTAHSRPTQRVGTLLGEGVSQQLLNYG